METTCVTASVDTCFYWEMCEKFNHGCVKQEGNRFSIKLHL